jgi:hypothetical protein
MMRLLAISVIGILVIVAGGTLLPQDNSIVVHVINGKNGTPLAHAHVLIFGGSSAEDIRHNGKPYSLQTDANGLAVLTLSPTVSQLKVFVDWHTVCRKESPNLVSYSVAGIKAQGINTPNNCGSASRSSAPGHFFVFVRDMTSQEKMAT